MDHPDSYPVGPVGAEDSERERRPAAGAPAARTEPERQRYGLFWAGLVLLILLVAGLSRFAPDTVSNTFQTLITIFLGILIEALPFLLAGSLVSGLIEMFVSRDALARFVPRRAVPAAFAGALLGFAFPVCECGVVPVTRRLYGKGLPVSVGVAFLLAAPVVNPIVLLSTYAAFGFGPILVGRFVFSFLIAALVGVIFSVARPSEVLLPETVAEAHYEHVHAPPVAVQGVIGRLWQVLIISGDDFLDMGRYLVIGSLVAASMQTLVPQSALLALGSSPVTSVLVMMVLAFVLSICSTVDAFLALSFVNSFTTGSILSFLVFGPMVDIKSSLMFLGVFQRRVVFYLILLPFLLSLLLGIFVNLNLAW